MYIETVKQSRQGILCMDKQIHKQKYKHVTSNTWTNINDSTRNWVKIPDQKLSVESLNTDRFKPTRGVAFKSMCKEEAHLVYKVQEVIGSKGKISSLLQASLLA